MTIEEMEKKRNVLVTSTHENRGEQVHTIVPSGELANGILSIWSMDSYGNPVSLFIPNEMVQISLTHNSVQLTQIPDDTQDIVILDANDIYLERVYDTNLLVDNENAFYVYENVGIIKFHPSKAGQTILISYYGKGVMMISDSRIFHNKEGSVVDTLDNILEKAQDGIKLVESAGGLVEAIKEIDRKTEAGYVVVDKIEETIEKAQMFGCVVDFTRQSFILKTEDGEVPASEIATVYAKLNAYKGGIPITPKIVSDNGLILGENCVLRVTENNEIRLVSINQSQEIKQAKCTVQIILSKDDLFVGNGEGTDVTIEREFVFAKVSDGEEIYDYTLSTPFNAFTSNYEGYVYQEQEVLIDLSVNKANLPVSINSVTVTIPTAFRGAFKSEVINNTQVRLTALTGALMPDNGSIAITVMVDGKALTKNFNFSKTKDGVASKLISIQGEQIFRYDNYECTGIPDLISTTLTSIVQNVSGQVTPLWTYKDDLGYYREMPADVVVDGMNIQISHDSAIWMDRKSVTVKCDIVDQSLFDTVTLVKVGTGKNGTDAYFVHLTNESHVVTLDNSNIVIDNVNNIFTDIEAYLGNQDISSQVEVTVVEEHECSVKIELTPAGKYRVKLKTIYEIDEAPDDSEEHRNDIRLEDGDDIELEDGSVTAEETCITLELGDDTPAMSTNDTSWVSFDVTYGDYTVRKVFTIAKSIQGADGSQGEKGDSIYIHVEDGTRSVTYSQVSHDPRPSISKTFRASLFNNGVEVDLSEVQFYWVATGHMSGSGVGNTFTPTISTLFNETIQNNEIRVTATYAGQNHVYYIPISVTRDANGLDWVQDWDGSKTEINDQMVLTPKIFAGTTRQEGGVMIPTGVAIGCEALNNKRSNGVVGYQDGEVSFMLDVDGSLLVGKMPTGNNVGLYYSKGQFLLNVNQLAISGIKVPNQDEVNNALTEGIQGAKDEFTETINNITGDLNDLNQALEEGLNDAELSATERSKVSAILESLRVEYQSILAQAEKIFSNPDFTNQILNESLTSNLQSYKTAFSSLEEVVTVILGTTGVVQPPLVADFNAKLATFTTATKTLQQTINDCLSAINQNIASGLIDSAKKEIDTEIKDVTDALESLDETMNGEFKAGLISSSKSIAIREKCDSINKQLTDVTAQYNTMMASDKLATSSKTRLTELKGQVDTKNSILQSLVGSTMVDYIFTEAEITAIRTAIDELFTALNTYNAFAQECNADIALNTAQGVVDAITDEEVFNKVTAHGVKQGLFIDDGNLYINGQWVQTRNLVAVRDDGTETFKIDNQGNVHLKVKSFTLTGDSTSNIYTKEDVDNKIDEVNQRNKYSVQVLSTNGTTFHNGKVSTVLKALLYLWDTDVTAEFAESQFIWTRVTGDTVADTAWNNAHKGMKQVTIEMTDLRRSATFNCDVVDANGKSILN